MLEKEETKNTKDARINFGLGNHSDNRLGEDRRQEPSEGFTYITIVGWIDRRERHRRKDDPFNY